MKLGLKSYVLVLIGVLQSLSLYSQSDSSFIQVLDADYGTPIVLAHVKITSTKGNAPLTRWMVTDELGQIVVIDKDSTLVEISHLGYQNQAIVLLPGQTKKIQLRAISMGLGEVVVSAGFIPIEKQNNLYDVRTIKPEKIEEKGANNLREALTTEVNFKTNNGHANETALMLNGLSGNHVKIMIDGVPIEGRLSGNLDLSQINLNEVKKVEIIEGPTSVAYGTNALGGVVNIITDKKQKKRISGGFNAYYESVGQYNFSANLGFKIKKNSFKINAGRNFFSGYTSGDTARYQEWKPREQYFGNFVFGRNINHLRFSYVFDGFTETMLSKGAPRFPYYSTAFDTRYKTNRLTNKVLLKGRVSKNKYLDLTLSHSYYQRVRNIYFKDLVSLEEIPTSSVNDHDTTTFNSLLARGVYNSDKDSTKVNYMLGMEAKHDFIQANRIEGKNQEIGDYSVFGNLKYTPFTALSIQPALRYSYNTKYTAPLIPSISFMFKPNKQWIVRASYAKGFRAPSLKELYLEFHFSPAINLWGNENLSAENSNHINLSVDWHKDFNDHQFRIVPKGYYSHINNLIDLIQTSNVDWTYKNADYLITKGISLGLYYKWNEINFSVTGSYYGNYNSMFDHPEIKNTFYYSSDLASELSYFIKPMGVKLSCFYKYTGEVRNSYLTDNNEILPSYIQDYHNIDLSAKKIFWKKRITVVAGVKNLLDVNDVKMIGDVYGVSNSNNSPTLSVLWGRTFFLSLKARF
ncbi:MAG: hypothetical protein CL840_19070 [Crocinitomicaceae bacterium]|nr:hypothetical protein [Crocinitomicaceae bacterium]